METPWPSSGHIGPYRIERRLGYGGMGVVYLGHHRGLAAAVKVIRPEHAADLHFRARLRREVAAARRVPRFCTAPVLEADLEADPPWVATEYVDGPALDAALVARGRLAGRALEAFAVGVAVALRAIHRHGVVHRDLKPSNVLLSDLGPRVIDFGIAQVEGARTQLTEEYGPMGTPAHMAPEQFGDGPVTAAADVFAWASLVTYAATARVPFGTGREAVTGILHGEPELGDLPYPLRGLVAAAFAKDPAARPSTDDLVERLSRASSAVTAEVLASAAKPQRPRRHGQRRRPVVAAAAVGTLAVALAAGTVALVGGDGPEPPPSAEETLSRRLAAESLAAVGTDQRRSMELALDAWAAAETPEARSALLSAHNLSYAGQLGTEPGGTSVAVDPAGTTVAVGQSDGTAQLWDVATGAPLGEPLTGHTSLVSRVAFSPDGTLLATASIETNGVRVWEVPGGRLVSTLPGLASVAWLPDGSTLVATVLREDATGNAVALLGAWDARTGQEIRTIPTGDPVFDVAASADGAFVAGGRDDGTATVWRLDDGTPVAEITGHDDSAVRVAFSTAGQLATVGLEGEIKLWELPEAGTPHVLTDSGSRVNGRLLFTPDGYLLATGGGSDVHWWDTPTGSSIGRLIGFDGTPLDVATSADGKLVAATGIDHPTVLWRRATYWLPHPAQVLDIAFNPSGERLATAGADGLVRVWDMATAAVAVTSTHPDQVRGVAFAPDGSFASASVDGTVRVHHPDGRERAVTAVDGESEAHDLAFSPDGSLLAVVASPAAAGGAGHRIHLWESRTLRRRGAVVLPDKGAAAIAFSPDSSRLLAVVGEEELRAWRTADLTEEHRIDLGPGQATDLAVSPDGGTLAVAGRQVQLYDLEDYRPAGGLGDHRSAVRSVAYSPDGRTVATVTADDDAVWLWDTGTGDLLAELPVLEGTSTAFAFSPDGGTLVAADADGWIARWATEPDDAIARICQDLSTGDETSHRVCG